MLTYLYGQLPRRRWPATILSGTELYSYLYFPQRSRKDDFDVQINMIRFRDTQTTFPSGRILPSLIITPQSQSLTLPIRQSLYTCPNLDPRLSRNDENRN